MEIALSLNRHAKARDANERPIIDALVAVGASVYQLDRPVDLLVGFKRETIVMEVKLPLGPRGGGGGSTTELQDEFFRTWQGGVAAVVRSVDEALALIGCETRGVEIGPRYGTATSPWLDGS